MKLAWFFVGMYTGAFAYQLYPSLWWFYGAVFVALVITHLDRKRNA